MAAEPALRCRVATQHPGRHLVRVSYATGGVAWRVSYRAELPAEVDALDQLDVTPVFALDAGAFPVARSARVRLYAGLPGGSEPPVLAWEGEASLGGGVVQVVGRASPRRARVDRVFRGAEVTDGDNPRGAAWHDSSTSEVWRELAFERSAADVPGPIRVAVTGDGGRSWIDGRIDAPQEPPVGAVRVSLWIEPDLIGYRRKRGTESGGSLIDQISYSVANRGTEPVTVVVEEELRGVARARVVFEQPSGRVGADRWQTSIEVVPGKLTTGAVAIRYHLRR